MPSRPGVAAKPMPDVTEPNQNTQELEQTVESLLQQAQSSVQRVGQRLAEPSGPPPQTAHPVGPAPRAAEGLGPSVDQMIKPAAAPEAAQAASIQSLDAELAKLADNLVEGGFEDATNVLADVPAPPAAEVTAAEETPIDEPALDEEPEPEATEAVADEAEPETEVAAAEPAAVKAEEEQAGIWKALEPPVLAGLAKVSGPVRGKPKVVRDLVGWLAVMTVFWALCVWGYIMIRKPGTPEKPEKAEAVKATGKHEEAAKPAAHPEKKTANAEHH
jgi:hypothetical protein